MSSHLFTVAFVQGVRRGSAHHLRDLLAEHGFEHGFEVMVGGAILDRGFKRADPMCAAYNRARAAQPGLSAYPVKPITKT